MGISEVQRKFSAYGSGELPEFELRECIRAAVSDEPQLSQAFLALTEAYRRANLIDDDLQSTINTDIAEATNPNLGLTMVRPPSACGSSHGWMKDPPRAANSTDVNMAFGAMTGPNAPMSRSSYTNPAYNPSGTGPMTSPGFNSRTDAQWRPTPTDAPLAHTGSTSGSSWDIAERLTDVAAPLYPGAVIRDRFVLVDELGRGGMGIVYKAYDRSRGDVKDRYVAIKVLNEEFKRHPLAVRALQRESRKAQRLAHPNVIGVYDFDRDDGNVYMVMEFLSGRSLERVIREDGQGGIPLEPACNIIKCLGAALSYAHQQDIVHCDFKPSNAFLTDEGKVKVLDFGIARAAPSLLEKGEATLFDAGALGAISPAYASLEMLQCKTPDIRDDVYALSCVIYELLTGVHPYQRIDAIKANDSGLQPRRIRKLSRGQWRALKQGLAFKRADRLPTIDSLVNPLLVTRSRAKYWLAGIAACIGVLAVGAALIWKWPDVLQGVAQFRIPTLTASIKPADRAPNTPVPAPARSEQEVRSPNDLAVSTSHQSTVDSSLSPVASTPTTLPGNARADEVVRELEDLLAKPVATPQWAAKTQDLLASLDPRASSAAFLTNEARSSGVRTFVAAASEARSRGQFEQAGNLLGIARSFNPEAAEIAAELAAIERDKLARGDFHASEAKRADVEMLKERFETQAAAADITQAAATASGLARAAPGSSYVIHDVPRVLALSHVRLAKSLFARGKVNESLQSLAEARKKFPKSPELKDLQRRYVDAADFYDRLSMAVVLNVADAKHSLEALKSSEGEEYDIAAQMLAQTLADRIADQRVAKREVVADKLLEAGNEAFPDYRGILSRGTAGVLTSTPILVDDNNGVLTPQQ